MRKRYCGYYTVTFPDNSISKGMYGPNGDKTTVKNVLIREIKNASGGGFLFGEWVISDGEKIVLSGTIGKK